MTAADGTRRTDYEAVIGLEVHVELATATKMFCGCANEFGAEPNTHICPVCLGLPGSLPVLNAQAVELVLRFAEAVHLHVPPRSIFARKNYFYPDMPKDYQISQYEDPITVDGWLEIDDARVGIERAHLEEDTGKTLHIGGGGRIHEASYSLVDYNRAGVPLMEIVSRPDIRSAEQARAYVSELRGVLEAVGVSDVKFEEGSMRVDANVSVRPRGTTELGVKVEVKNMNSLRSLGRAIDYEIERQVGGARSGRADRAGDASLERSRRPHAARCARRKARPTTATSPSPTSCPSRPTTRCGRGSASRCPSCRRCGAPGSSSEWGITGVRRPDPRRHARAGRLRRGGGARRSTTAPPRTSPTGASATCSPTSTRAGSRRWCCRSRPTGSPSSSTSSPTARCRATRPRTCSPSASREPKRPKQVVEERGLAQVSDEGELVAVIDGILAANPSDVDDYRNGDDKVRKKKHGFFMGEAMKATKGQGNPQVLTRLIRERLERH